MKRHFDRVARLLIAGAVALTLLSLACATGPRYGPDSPVTTIVVPIEQLAFPPFLPKLPATVGIYFPESFRAASVMTGGGYFPRCRYEIGTSTTALYSQNVTAMFARTVELPSPPMPATAEAEVDIVLVAQFEQLTSLVFFDVASPMTIPSAFKLGIDVLEADGSRITKIETLVAPPVVPDTEQPSELQQTAQGVAIRVLPGAVGDLATLLVLSPELARWARTRGFAWQWKEQPATDRAAASPAGVAIVFCSGLSSRSATKGTVAVGKALQKLDPTVEIVDAEKLLRSLYPWMGKTSLTKAQEAEWLRNPAVGARAATTAVRYLVMADVLEQWTTQHGSIFGGYPAGAFGLGWWKDHESVRLRVFDLVAAGYTNDIEHQREYVSLVAPVVVLPMPIPIPQSGKEMYEAIAEQLLPLVRPAR